MNQKELIVKIEKIVPNGYGLGFAEGLTVFVWLAAKGDLLRVRVRETKGKTAFAEIVEILEPSPDRVEPGCAYFGACGGCDFQQLSYEAQLEAKVGIIRDCLERIGKIDYDREIAVVGSPQPYGYRGRALWHLNTKNRSIGYYRRNSNELVDVSHCPILTDRMQETLAGLRSDVKWENFSAEKAQVEATSAGGQTSVYSAEIFEPTHEVVFTAGGERYAYDARSFFQGNPLLIEKLIETAVGGAGGGTALDLYCGVGLFTLPLARKFKKVYGVEASERAIEFARRNIENARLDNAEVFAEGVGRWLTRSEPGPVDFVLLDPPRAGTEKETIYRILKIKPAEISYVSCEPSTLARDLRRLTEGGYEIDSITAVDLFPQTHHIETVVRLTRSEPR